MKNRELFTAFGPSGQEQDCAALIASLTAPYVEEQRTDAMGNLILHKKGPGAKVMFCAHMDTIGLMATGFDEHGFVRFTPLGGFVPADLARAKVRFHSVVEGTICVAENKSGELFRMEDLTLDIGCTSKEAAEKRVKLGDCAVFCQSPVVQDDALMGSYLDNRAGCWALVQAIASIRAPQNDLYFVFSTQEEIGCRGARTAAYSIAPDVGIVIDVTDSNDVPGCRNQCSSRMGKGAAIKVMDHSVLCSPAVVAWMNRLAEERQIPVQQDILADAGTDGGSILSARGGVLTGGISIACRHVHTPMEVCSMRDVDACVQLITAIAEREFSADEQ